MMATLLLTIVVFLVAVLAMGSLRRWPLGTIAKRATQYASHVASCPGATPPIPESLVATISQP